MNVSGPDRTGRPQHPLIPERALLLILVASLLGVLAATSPAWAIGLTIGLASLSVLNHFTGSGPDRSGDGEGWHSALGLVNDPEAVPADPEVSQTGRQPGRERSPPAPPHSSAPPHAVAVVV